MQFDERAVGRAPCCPPMRERPCRVADLDDGGSPTACALGGNAHIQIQIKHVTIAVDPEKGVFLE